MYHIYHVSGIVVARFQRGEQDVVASILTDDPALGLVRAYATSGAASASRMRVALEPLTEGCFAFVRGRHRWRLVGAQARAWHAPQIVRSGNGQAASALLRFVSDAIPSEGMLSPEVFALVERFVRRAAREPIPSTRVLGEFVAPLLHALGYLPSPAVPREETLAQALWAAGSPNTVYYLYATKRPPARFGAELRASSA